MRHIGATPAEQIVWLENRVKELEEQLYLQHQCKEALEHELSSTQSTISSYPSPAEALSAVIQWNIDVATDPLTNGGMVSVPVEPTPAITKALKADFPLSTQGVRLIYSLIIKAAQE